MKEGKISKNEVVLRLFSAFVVLSLLLLAAPSTGAPAKKKGGFGSQADQAEWTQEGKVWYLAEGSTAGGFETWILIENPSSTEANVELTYLGSEGSYPGPKIKLAPGSRKSVNVSDTCPNTWEVSTKVTSDVPVIAERTMYWNGRRGGHNSTGYLQSALLVPPSTKILTDETLGELESVSQDGVLTFKKSNSQLESIVTGDVLICGKSDKTPYGLLRKVTSKKTEGRKLLINTEQASLEETVKEGTLTVEKALNASNVQSMTPLVKGVRLEKEKGGSGLQIVVSKDIDLNGAKLSGEITFEQEFDLACDIDYNPLKPLDPPRLVELNLTTRTNDDASLKLTTEVPLELKTEKEIARYTFAPIVVPGVPVVIVPIITVKLGASGKVTANLTTNIRQTGQFTAGLTYSGGVWNTISGFSNDFGFGQPQISAGKASAKAFVKPQLSLLLYGVVGPYAGIEGYLALDADPNIDPWWSFYGGVKGDVGVEIRILSKTITPYSKTVFEWKKILAQAESKKEEPEEQNKGKLYWDGTEFISMNSGFTGDGGTSRSKAPAPDGHLYLYAHSGFMSRCQIAWSTDCAVDLTGYNKLCIEWSNDGSTNDCNESYLIAATNNYDKQENQASSDKLIRTSSFARRVDYLDISNINEPRYIRVHVRDGDYWGTGNYCHLYVFRIWLE